MFRLVAEPKRRRRATALVAASELPAVTLSAHGASGLLVKFRSIVLSSGV
jgi:hypothetical protein